MDGVHGVVIGVGREVRRERSAAKTVQFDSCRLDFDSSSAQCVWAISKACLALAESITHDDTMAVPNVKSLCN